jgi:hypothetical protein
MNEVTNGKFDPVNLMKAYEVLGLATELKGREP